MATASLGNAGIPTITTGNLRDANRTGTNSSNVAAACTYRVLARKPYLHRRYYFRAWGWRWRRSPSVGKRAAERHPAQLLFHPPVDHTSRRSTSADPGRCRDIKLNIDPSKPGNLLMLAIFTSVPRLFRRPRTTKRTSGWPPDDY